MSEALDYLLKIRPEAMRSYFDFIKQSTSHLDPKTRAIISVITKVDNQTETGFKQYLKRALQAGITADEIIDALFMAFPTLGLSKIVWATDIIIKMNIPDFDLDKIGQKMTWHDVIGINEVVEDKITVISYEDRYIFIYKGNGHLNAYDNCCPHQSTRIPKSGLSDSELTCPKHGWKFNLKTGVCIEKGNKPLQKFDTKIDNNRLYIRW